MHIILGGTGHVGSVLTQLLQDKGEKVMVVTHDAAKKNKLEQQGYQVAVVDIHDVEALRQTFQQGQRAFLLNPPADPTTDTDKEEKKTVQAILQALDDSGLHKVVATSTMSAQEIERAGDLGVLYRLEQGLAAQTIPASIIRSGYYLSNWDESLKSAQQDGIIQTIYPAALKMPMVAPADIARLAARLLLDPIKGTGLYELEGPERYSPDDVGLAFAAALGKPVKVIATPREQWVEAYKKLGFSQAAAQSYARMVEVTVDDIQQGRQTGQLVRGETTLQAYITELVQKS